MKYIIPIIPPSLNKYAGRENQWDYRAAKSEWKQICRAYCRPRGKPPRFVEVNITFFFPDRRRRDPDNYCKLLLDGLVYAGVIADDDFGHIRLSLSAGVDKKNPRVEVTVDEVQCTTETDAQRARD